MHVHVSIHCVVVCICVAAVAGGFEVEHYIRAMEQDGFSFDKHHIVNVVLCRVLH